MFARNSCWHPLLKYVCVECTPSGRMRGDVSLVASHVGLSSSQHPHEQRISSGARVGIRSDQQLNLYLLVTGYLAQFWHPRGVRRQPTLAVLRPQRAGDRAGFPPSFLDSRYKRLVFLPAGAWIGLFGEFAVSSLQLIFQIFFPVTICLLQERFGCLDGCRRR